MSKMQIEISLEDYNRLIPMIEEAGIKMNKFNCLFIYEAGDKLTVPDQCADQVRTIMKSAAWRNRDK